MTVNGEHAWRPEALLKTATVPTGEFLVAARDAGLRAGTCPPQMPGQTNFGCPVFEGLADTRGGPSIIPLAWEHVPIQQAPALVLRVTAEPIPPCVSIPSGGCPGLTLDAVSLVWAGDPG
jgi:hypothetical protein